MVRYLVIRPIIHDYGLGNCRGQIKRFNGNFQRPVSIFPIKQLPGRQVFGFVTIIRLDVNIKSI